MRYRQSGRPGSLGRGRGHNSGLPAPRATAKGASGGGHARAAGGAAVEVEAVTLVRQKSGEHRDAAVAARGEARAEASGRVAPVLLRRQTPVEERASATAHTHTHASTTACRPACEA